MSERVVFSEAKEASKPKTKRNVGASVSIVLIGLSFLVFPKWVGLTDGFAWAFYVVGFVIWLFGLIGAGVEWDKR